MTAAERENQRVIGLAFRQLRRLRTFDLFMRDGSPWVRYPRCPNWTIAEAPLDPRRMKRALELGPFWGFTFSIKARHWCRLWQVLRELAETAGATPTHIRELTVPPDIRGALGGLSGGGGATQ
ncbi:MAG: hypothetical protein ACE141_15655 [Bryobacteraceae bacterium]